MSTLLVSGRALLVNGEIAEATLRLANGRIARIDSGIDPAADLRTDGVIAPGLIDLQINGGWGHDFTSDGSSAVIVARQLVSTGVTAFLPTIITSPLADYPRRLAEIAAAGADAGLLRPAPTSQANAGTTPAASYGATILGAHLEGPYLNPLYAGAHDPTLLRPIDLNELLAWADHPLVSLVTLAPELPAGLAAVRALRDRGVIVSAGHSNATAAEATAAFAAGVSWGTHLFNAMRPLHHREPGLVGALLAGPVPFGLIADGIHIHPIALRLAAARGAAGIVLVTDAMASLGQPPGIYQLGRQAVTVTTTPKEPQRTAQTGVDDGAGAAGMMTTARLADGTLAGSLLTLDQAIRNMVTWQCCDLAGALTMATATPARLLGLATKGRLTIGADADLVIFDQRLRVSHTFINGCLVYQGD